LRTALGFAAAAVLLLLALGAALLASDVRSWQAAVKNDDALLATSPRAATWRPPTYLSSLSERVLGIGDGVALRRATALFAGIVDVPTRLDNAQQVALARSRAEQALAAAARPGNGPSASQAETLLGVLVFTDVVPSTDPFEQATAVDPGQVQSSVTDFQDAVRADPDNAIAKYDLELALRTLLAKGIRIQAGTRSGAGATGRQGAGGGAVGGGY
jgi:hypothetical protein